MSSYDVPRRVPPQPPPPPPRYKDSYNRDDNRYSDNRYSRDDNRYSRDDNRYNSDSRYNRDDGRYSRDDNRYNRDENRYSRDDNRYNREDNRYNRDDNRYNRDDNGYDNRYKRDDGREYHPRSYLGQMCGLCDKPAKLEEWIAVGPKGQRDVRKIADPHSSHNRWVFYHIRCVKEKKGHAANHPDCARPKGPCTDWHLRGKCKRGFDCGHCHFDHPELLEKYPELPKDGVLRRPQRRERLAMLKKAYEDDIGKYLTGDDDQQRLEDFLRGTGVALRDGAGAQEAFRVAIHELEKEEGEDGVDTVDKWRTMFKTKEYVREGMELKKKLVKDADRHPGDASLLVKRFLRCGDNFEEVVSKLQQSKPGVTPAKFEDLVGYVVDAADLEETVERMEELAGLN